MEVAGWGGRLLWGFVYSEGDCWRDLVEGAAEKVDTFSGGRPFCVVLVRLRSYVIMDGVLGWTQRQAKALTALRPAKEKEQGHVQVDNRSTVCCSWYYIVPIIGSNEVQRSMACTYVVKMPATFPCLFLNCNKVI